MVSRETVYHADIVVQLKRPDPEVLPLFNGNVLFCMGHHEEDPWMVEGLLKQNVLLVEMEKLKDVVGDRVINQCDLTGEVAVYMVQQYLDKLPVDTKAIVIGQGNTAQGALKACNKLGIQTKFMRRAQLPHLIDYLQDADLLISGIPWTAQEKADPHYILTQKDLKKLPRHLIILDLVCGEAPNPIETLRPSTFEEPCYTVDGIRHISLWGYPGLVPVSSARIYSPQVLSMLKLLLTIPKELWITHWQLRDAILPFLQSAERLRDANKSN
jgi:alanine dehydrogenase